MYCKTMNMSSSRIISIEGNIGSGKSSFLSYLKNKYADNNNIIFLKEPVDEWESIRDENGKTMLQKFYEDPKKYSFSFQMMAYISRLSILVKAQSSNPSYIITERCLLTDKFIFAKMLYDEGKIERVEYEIYNKWFDEFNKNHTITDIVYIKTNPQTCIDRINKRARSGEESITLDYISKCHLYHNEYIKQVTKLKSIRLVEIDGNTNLEKKDDIDTLYNEWFQSLSINI